MADRRGYRGYDAERPQYERSSRDGSPRRSYASTPLGSSHASGATGSRSRAGASTEYAPFTDGGQARSSRRSYGADARAAASTRATASTGRRHTSAETRAGTSARATSRNGAQRNSANARTASRREFGASASSDMPRLRNSRDAGTQRGGARSASAARGTGSRGFLSGVLQVLGWLPRTIAHILGSLFSRVPKRVLAGGAAAIIVAVALVVGVSSLMRSCSRNQAGDVAVSPDTLASTLAARTGTAYEPALEKASTSSLQTAAATLLDQDELMAWIAAHASAYDSYAGLDAYSSYHALTLSCRIPQALHFVYSLGESTANASLRGGEPASSSSTGSSQGSASTSDARQQAAGSASTGSSSTALPYTGGVTKGEAPILYQWDERWGSYDYCGHPLGFTGCGITVASMAYMGLTGNSDLTPAKMADLATETGEAALGTNATFFTNAEVEAATGISGAKIYDTAEALTAALNDNKLVAISVRPDTLAGGDHWVLAVGVEADGSIRINDPNSPANTAKSWDAAELVGYVNSMYALGVAA